MNLAGIIPLVRDLAARVSRLEAQSAWARPGRGGGGNQAFILTIKTGTAAGQTIYSSGGTTLYGVKRVTSAITALTSAWEPAATTAITQNGVGRATLHKTGGTTEDVLVLLDPTCPYDVDAMAGLPMVSYSSVSLPVTGGGSATVYRLWLGAS